MRKPEEEIHLISGFSAYPSSIRAIKALYLLLYAKRKALCLDRPTRARAGVRKGRGRGRGGGGRS